MAYNKETKQAGQDAYHEARAFGHTKEESQSIRDNWKTSNSRKNFGCDSDEYYMSSPEPYSQDCCDD